MAIFSFINELTVNGKPVEEDEEEKDDDYTTDEEDTGEETPEDNTDDGGESQELDLDPNSTEEETPEDDGGEDTGLDLDPNSDGGNEGDPDNDDDDSDDLDNDYTLQATQDDQDAETDDTSADDGTADAGDADTNDADTEPADNPEGDTGGDDAGDNGLDMGGDDDDYTTDTGEEGSEDDNTTDDDTVAPEDDITDLESKIKQTEAEIFNSLSDEEKAIKSRELIDDFVIAKQTVKVFLEKIRTITPTDENMAILAFVEANLLELNNIITSYIIERYSKKSYVENFILYQQILLTITQLKDIISKIKVDEKDEK